MLTREEWDRRRPDDNPFLSFDFFEALRRGGCTGAAAGWGPVEFTAGDVTLVTFRKTHSYGEFIFDWAWAQAYERYGVPYYPKFTAMVPFSPVTTRHFLCAKFDPERAGRVLEEFEDALAAGPESGAHFLYLAPEEVPFFETQGYLLRETLQYHFVNEELRDFDDFLGTLRSKKAKQLRAERAHPELEIRPLTGDDLTAEHGARMYRYYLTTIEGKNSFDYLTESFFRTVFETLRHNILFVEAYHRSAPVAGALFFFDREKLYGRYWGALSFQRNLHFELCYYQGMDFVFRRGLKVFEAGAQGEHKLLRGFRPVSVFSAHKLKHSAFRGAIADFIRRETAELRALKPELAKALPFRR
jgi:predicted N-acyltransferase